LRTGADDNLGAILVVDDHPMLREGIASLLLAESSMVLVGEACDGVEAVAAFRRLRPDVTLMDLQMPHLDGLGAIQAIRSEFPDARIIVLTTYAGDVKALSAIKAGAAGFLLKSSLRTDLLETIHNVHGGRRHLQAEVATDIALHAVDEPLNSRDIRILELISLGSANKQIAFTLGVSEDTVKAHL